MSLYMLSWYTNYQHGRNTIHAQVNRTEFDWNFTALTHSEHQFNTTSAIHASHAFAYRSKLAHQHNCPKRRRAGECVRQGEGVGGGGGRNTLKKRAPKPLGNPRQQMAQQPQPTLHSGGAVEVAAAPRRTLNTTSAQALPPPPRQGEARVAPRSSLQATNTRAPRSPTTKGASKGGSSLHQQAPCIRLHIQRLAACLSGASGKLQSPYAMLEAPNDERLRGLPATPTLYQALKHQVVVKHPRYSGGSSASPKTRLPICMDCVVLATRRNSAHGARIRRRPCRATLAPLFLAAHSPPTRRWSHWCRTAPLALV